jgi:hypothetical protein
MLWTIVLLLVVLWVLGFVFGVFGGFIHVLLFLAILVALARFAQGRLPVR